MANNKKKSKAAAADSSLDKVTDYRFPKATRKNNPPANIAAEGHVPLVPKAEYTFSPRRQLLASLLDNGRTFVVFDNLHDALKSDRP
jgi:hypothetical protein